MASEDDDEQGSASTTGPADKGVCLNSAELQAALRALSSVDLKRLGYAAAVLTRDIAITADELVSEALHAAWAGRRHCPREVSVVVFLTGAMRSLASSAKKAATRSKVVPFPTAQDDPFEHALHPGLDPEQELLDREDAADAETISAAARIAVQMLNDHFSDDYQVQLCIAGMMEGMSGKELRDFVGVNQADLDYAKKKIRRANRTLFPRGWRNVTH
jgi:DNA-directed RNA polymerase specialized sigma24 family protein